MLADNEDRRGDEERCIGQGVPFALGEHGLVGHRDSSSRSVRPAPGHDGDLTSRVRSLDTGFGPVNSLAEVPCVSVANP